MKNVIQFLPVLVMLLFTNCKKEEVNPAVEAGEQKSCVCDTEQIGVALGNTVNCSGFLIISTYSEIINSQFFKSVQCRAMFTKVPTWQEGGDSLTPVDSVQLNQQALASVVDTLNVPMYYERMEDAMPAKQDWVVYGMNGIPSFSYSAAVENPEADFSQLPDVLSKSRVQAFMIKGVKNITGGSVSIALFGISGNNVSVKLQNGVNLICFPEEQLKSLGSGEAMITVMMDNTITKEFGGKTFAFSKRLQFQKRLNLLP